MAVSKFTLLRSAPRSREKIYQVYASRLCQLRPQFGTICDDGPYEGPLRLASNVV